MSSFDSVLNNSTLSDSTSPYGECRLFQGVFAFLVQGTLGFLCVLTLIIKRQTEIPRREWNVWFLDAMKQGLGSSLSHFTNIFLSEFIVTDISGGDECQWYCIAYLLDSSFGIMFNLSFLGFIEILAAKYSDTEILKFGEYGNPPKMMLFFPQLAIWLLIVITGKIGITIVQLYLSKPLGIGIKWVLSWFHKRPPLELVLVMIIIPVIVNAVQFWLTDSFLKKDEKQQADKNNHIPLDQDSDDDLITNVKSSRRKTNSLPQNRSSNPNWFGFFNRSRSSTRSDLDHVELIDKNANALNDFEEEFDPLDDFNYDKRTTWGAIYNIFIGQNTRTRVKDSKRNLKQSTDPYISLADDDDGVII
jgi:hypothetical protein